MAEEYRWLVYMAGDNDLGERVNPVLAQIEAGVSEVVSAAVHADFFNQHSKHVVVSKGGGRVDASLGRNSNTGRSTTLTEFLRKGTNGAKHQIACVWGHAYGWFAAAFDAGGDRAVPIQNRKTVMAVTRGLFKTSAETAVQKAAEAPVDESERDFLDLSELRTGLQSGLRPGNKFAVIGCDACYMAMAEVAYELRDVGEILVASEEEEDAPGWNYEAVFNGFEPGLSPTEAARKIVDAYAPQTQREPRATLSAINLEEMGEVAEALNELGRQLTPLIGTPRFEAIKKARIDVHTFKLYHYIDLGHFAECLKNALGDDDEVDDVKDAADDVIKAVKGAVIATRNGTSAKAAHGLAVYLPNEPVNDEYAKLALAQAAPQWAKFVETYGANR